jgi:hypothetical protein
MSELPRNKDALVSLARVYLQQSKIFRAYARENNKPAHKAHSFTLLEWAENARRAALAMVSKPVQLALF